MSMEFWGVKVVAGKQREVDPGAGRFIHVSQAAIHNSKKFKDNDFLTLYVKINDENFVLGKLSPDGTAQQFDLVFEKEFVLSHSGKSGSVYICGYSSSNSVEIATEDASDDSEEDDPSKTKLSDEDKKSKDEDEESSEDSESYEDSEDGFVKIRPPKKPEAGKKRSLEPEGGSNKKEKLAAPKGTDTVNSKKNTTKSDGARNKA